MAKKQKMISISEELIQHLRENSAVPNFSEWVEETYRASFPVETLLESEIKLIRKNLYSKQKELAKKNQNGQNLRGELIKYDQNTRDVLLKLYTAVKKGFDESAVYRNGRANYGLIMSEKDFKKVMQEMSASPAQ